VGGVQAQGVRRRPRAADPPLRAAGQVRGRPGLGWPATEHRAGRSGVLWHLRPDRRELRAIDWIPRSVRFKAREVEKAYVALENRLHRSPTNAEVAQQLGITTDELHQIFNQISFVSVVALDELLSVGSERGDRLSLVDTLEDKGAEDPVAVFESQEMKGILAGAINRLGEREKIVITLYHYEGLTLAEIGQVLGVTESRVCQMDTKAVLQLRAKMQDAR
jgi:RNA polymerase sigma factor for flagellar operon FliA